MTTSDINILNGLIDIKDFSILGQCLIVRLKMLRAGHGQRVEKEWRPSQAPNVSDGTDLQNRIWKT